MMAASRERACAACDLQLYGQGNACQSCGAIYCGSCFSLKAKLDSSMGKTGSSTTPCQSCINLLKIKKQSKPSSDESSSMPLTSSNAGSSPSNYQLHTDHQPSQASKGHQANKGNQANNGYQAIKGTNDIAVPNIPAEKWEYPNHQSTASTKLQHGQQSGMNDFNDGWSDVDERPKTSKANLDDIFKDIPFALRMCGLVDEDEITIASYKHMISMIEEERQKLGQKQQQLKDKIAILSKRDDTLGVQNESNYMWNDSNEGLQREENFDNATFKQPFSTGGKNLDMPKPRKNQSELGNIVSNQTPANDTDWDNQSFISSPISLATASDIGEEMKLDPSNRSSARVHTSAQMTAQYHTKNDHNDDHRNINDSYGQELKQSNLFKSNQDSATSGAIETDTRNSKPLKHQPISAGTHKSDRNQNLPSREVSFQMTMSSSAGVSTMRASIAFNQPKINTEHSLKTETFQNVQQGDGHQNVPANAITADKDNHENTSRTQSKSKPTAEKTNVETNTAPAINRLNALDKRGSEVSQTDDKHVLAGVDKKTRKDTAKPKPALAEDGDVMFNHNTSIESPPDRTTNTWTASVKKTPEKVKKAEEFVNLESLEKDDVDDQQEETRNEPFALSLVSDSALDPVSSLFVLALPPTSGSKAPTALVFMGDSKSSMSSMFGGSKSPMLGGSKSPMLGGTKSPMFNKNKRQNMKISEIPIDEGKTKLSDNEKSQHTPTSNTKTTPTKSSSSATNKKPSNKNSSPHPGRLITTEKQDAMDRPSSTPWTVNSPQLANTGDLPNKNTVLTGSNIAPSASRTTEGSKPMASKEKDSSTSSTPAPVLKLRKSAGASSIAEKYHMGFLRLKQRQTDMGGQRCSSCGRSECQGENMQSMTRMIKSARENGFQLQDVTPDGNCMFAAVVDQLTMYGDERFTSRSLRQAAIRWLEDHPYTECGTPKSEFLAEDWYHYIDRMGKDGEWGDHMILGAVVEVVGCTIRVMSPTDTAVHWTTLEPQGEGAATDDKHLILGHVGEFHYTSLRPTAQQKEAAKSNTADWQAVEEDRTETEEDVLVSMFREDYIDQLSDLPVAHLSYLLKTIIPVSVLDTATIYMSEHSTDSADEVGPDGFQGSYKPMGICVGGIAEGVHVPALDEFVSADTSEAPMTTIFYANINKALKVVPRDTPLEYSNDCTECILEEAGSKPGCTSVLIKETMLHLVFANSEMNDKFDFGKNLKVTKTLFPVRAMKCHVWPESARFWQTRQRFQGWPSEDFIQSVVSEGCLVRQPSQPDPSGILWEFWFALVEKRIFREIASQHQKHCYIMFKTLCRQTFLLFDKVAQAVKNIFFYACEHIPLEDWETNPGACVLHMLEELLKGIQSRQVASYFIEDHNLLEGLSDSDLERLNEEVQILRLQPLIYLRQVHEIARLQHKGHEIIDRVADDIPSFKQHKSVRRSILDAFVPSTILIAKDNILIKQYRKGYEILSNAYEERLAISTCDDSMAYQMFLTAALSGLDLKSMTWFSAYADRNLQGQLSRSLIRELCSDLPLGKISQLLPADVAGEYSNTEVPLEFFQNIGQFCIDFAKFLYMIERIPAALPVLYHCYERYKEERKSRGSGELQAVEGQGEEFFPEVQDGAMLEVFVGMCRIYTHQGQLEFFKGLIPEIKLLCERLNTTEALVTLVYFCQTTNDLMPMQDIMMRHPNMVNEVKHSSRALFTQLSTWPYTAKLVYNV